MTDRLRSGLRPDALYGRSSRELLAAMRALRVVPGPQDPSQARMLHLAATRIGRTVVDVDRGRVLLGWDPDAEGVWAGEGMDAVPLRAPGAAAAAAHPGSVPEVLLDRSGHTDLSGATGQH
jgi:hypothetical protein